jgi:chromosome segregation ATPase
MVDEWNSIGFVPFKLKDRIAAQFKEAIEPFSNVVRVDRSRRRSQRGSSARETASPRDKLMRQYENKKNEIQIYENNLASINTSSSSGNTLVDSIRENIESLKAEAEELMEQIRQLEDSETK